uniref:Uncharacterized protein n=1 Tax=Tanacetum cinerariifolium TaxID=118510 RepID=A0A699GLY2_TANCI|nr:hypothetical protein [Tanacetum cinerariifolium]
MFPRRSEDEDSKYPFFEGDGSSSDEWREYDVIEKEEGFIGKKGFGGEEDCIEDVIVVANDLCSSMIQTTLNVDFGENLNTKSHELMSFGKLLLSSHADCLPLSILRVISEPPILHIRLDREDYDNLSLICVVFFWESRKIARA